MPYWLLDMLTITGSLALFIYGMHVMSDGIQRAAGGQLRKTLRSITKRPLRGVLVGALTTGIVQSSSATTVMTISFVNAGLITVYQSIGLIMGANIGTTITAWLVSLGAFLFKLSTIIIPMLTLAVPVFFRGSRRNQYWAQTMIGFCLLFIGLGFLTQTLPSLEVPAVYDAISAFTSLGLLSRVIFVAVGLILTILIQSSSAAMTLTIALIYGELIPLELGCAMILGENIGTCITAEIAALVGNYRARQSATIHTLFNVIGAIWMIFLLGPVITVLQDVVDFFSGNVASFSIPKYATIGLAAFHTTFNILNTILLFPFLKMLESLAARLRTKSVTEKESHIKYMDSSVPELTSVALQTELIHFSDTVNGMLRETKRLLNMIDQDEQLSLANRLIAKSKNNLYYHKALSDYVVKLVKSELTEKTSDRIQRYISIGSDLQRLSNLVATISYEFKDKTTQRIWFSIDQRTNLNRMYDLVFEALDIMTEHFAAGQFEGVDITRAHQIEDKINELRTEYRSTIKDTTDKFDFNIEGTMIYFRIFTLLEKVGDKIYDIADAMGPTPAFYSNAEDLQMPQQTSLVK